MRHKRTTVYILSLLFAVIAFVFGAQDSSQDTSSLFSLTIISAEGEEHLQYWENNNGDIYVFLPSYASLSQVSLKPVSANNLKFNGQPFSDILSCECLQLNQSYIVSYSEDNVEIEKKIVFMQSENTPAMYIDVRSGNMDYIHQENGNKEPGRIRLYTEDGLLNYVGDLSAIHGRGNSTWMSFEKKPYSLELSIAGNLLNMGTAKNWVLLSNSFDSSHLRNKIVFDFASDIGLPYSPDSQWVDLFLNGEYAGLYLLCERNEVHPERISLNTEETALVSVDIDWRLEQKGVPFFQTDSGTAFRIHSSTLPSETLKNQFQAVENAIFSKSGKDPQTQKSWNELIDLDSWVKMILIQEVFANADAGSASQYFYTDNTTGKIYAGPVWDCDISMGNPKAWRLDSTNALFAIRPLSFPIDNSSWFYHLYAKEEFYAELVSQYKNNFLPLLTQYINFTIPQYEQQISKAAALNQIRWSVSSAVDDTHTLLTYLNNRIPFLNSLWLNDTEYYTIFVDYNDGLNTGHYLVSSGDTLSILSRFEQVYGAQLWLSSSCGKPFDINQPIYEDAAIYRAEATQ